MSLCYIKQLWKLCSPEARITKERSKQEGPALGYRSARFGEGMQEMEILPDSVFFPALYQLSKELLKLVPRVNIFMDSQPKAVSEHKLNGQCKPLIPLRLDCCP